jgi:TonB family protein
LSVLHLDSTGLDTPHLPDRGLGLMTQFGASAMAHAAGAVAIILVLGSERGTAVANQPNETPCVDVTPIVFIASPGGPSGGGGGGGDRTHGPIRRAQGKGADDATLRTRKTRAEAVPRPANAVIDNVFVPPSVVVDAVPLSSGTFEQIGLPSGGLPGGTSLGPGSGGGVGTGTGTGIGSGKGPGIGAGTGGGTGGGTFRPGGAVTAPRVIAEVRPKYTNWALRNRIQGTVELELVVTRDGRASRIRVVRSLDAGGLDDEAVAAVSLWRFEPGRLAGAPVDVLVTVLLDFTIR